MRALGLFFAVVLAGTCFADPPPIYMPCYWASGEVDNSYVNTTCYADALEASPGTEFDLDFNSPNLIVLGDLPLLPPLYLWPEATHRKATGGDADADIGTGTYSSFQGSAEEKCTYAKLGANKYGQMKVDFELTVQGITEAIGDDVAQGYSLPGMFVDRKRNFVYTTTIPGNPWVYSKHEIRVNLTDPGADVGMAMTFYAEFKEPDHADSFGSIEGSYDAVADKWTIVKKENTFGQWSVENPGAWVFETTSYVYGKALGVTATSWLRCHTYDEVMEAKIRIAEFQTGTGAAKLNGSLFGDPGEDLTLSQTVWDPASSSWVQVARSAKGSIEIVCVGAWTL